MPYFKATRLVFEPEFILPLLIKVAFLYVYATLAAQRRIKLVGAVFFQFRVTSVASTVRFIFGALRLLK
jgi:hypothetical protein